LLLRILLGILVVAAVLAGAIAYAAFRLPQPIQIDMSGSRRALLYRLSGGPRPTPIVLHSYSGDALTTARYSGFLQAALPRGFNVVFPEAVGHEWHDSPEGNPAHADDVAFVAALVEKLTAEQISDPHRTLVAGISNGGMMAFALVCARPDLFAGIGTISAGMPKDAFASRRPTKPMRLLMIKRRCRRRAALRRRACRRSGQLLSPYRGRRRNGEAVRAREWLRGGKRTATHSDARQQTSYRADRMELPFECDRHCHQGHRRRP